MQLYAPRQLRFGCDPELFLSSQDGKIVGSELVIPKEGINTRSPATHDGRNYLGIGKVVLDGVQVEIHTTPDPCRARIGNQMKEIFIRLREHLAKTPEITASFKPVVTVSKDELDKLSAESRRLGCMPSKNVHDATASINVNPDTYRVRSAGGHLHFGDLGIDYGRILNDEAKAVKFVQLLDLFLGNTCVLIDRDPSAAERRKVYGRAGEWRHPEYGVEYRTLSNFWLRAYPLMSMVFGISRLAFSILQTDIRYPDKNIFRNLMELVPRDAVKEAINKNDYDLAFANWQKVRQWLLDNEIRYHTIGADSMEDFDFFLKAIKEKGLEFWFPEEPMDHWCNFTEGHGTGFESFLSRKVSKERLLADGHPVEALYQPYTGSPWIVEPTYNNPLVSKLKAYR